MDRGEITTCEWCEAEFQVITFDEDTDISYCPFCGGEIEGQDEDFDDADDDSDDGWEDDE